MDNVLESFHIMTRAARILVALTSLALGGGAAAQQDGAPAADSPERTAPVEPFHIIGNVWYVGRTVHNPSFLITGEEGHIIVDSTYEEFVPAIAANVEKLGFDIRDVKIILSSHAHHDHVGGHAKLKEITGAMVMASDADAEVIETGGLADFRDGEPWMPAVVDLYLRDRQTVRLGAIALTANLTPGHTRGCTTWTTQVREAGRTYDLVLVCGFRMDEDSPLVDNPEYPLMAQDFAHSFAVARTLPADVFLGAHGYWFDLAGKIERLQDNPGVNPFLNAGEYSRLIDTWERAYLERLKAEREAKREDAILPQAP